MKFTRQSSIYRGRVVQWRWLGVGFGAAAIVAALSTLGAHSLATPVVSVHSPNTPSSRNHQRTADLTVLSEALHQYMTRHSRLPITLPPNGLDICTSQGAVCKTAKLADLGFLIGTGDSLAAIPQDPIGGAGQFNSGYHVARNEFGQWQLTAPRAEAGATIAVTR
ncbi:MAG TPA: hypothetical protein VLI05_04685 [Candidatus Saccharimonadia bacterium]|nr:hypothetical protein [Candidatus Saccharimonadia bacterium]